MYDTTSTTKPVIGGEKTTDEMCLVFMKYYPRVPYLNQPALTIVYEGQQLVVCPDWQTLVPVPNTAGITPYVEPARDVCRTKKGRGERK